MAIGNHKQQMITTQDGERILPPIVGRLTWIGSNLGLDIPIFLHVEDEMGVEHTLGLAETLERIDQFRGYRGNQPVKENIIDCAFIAYESNLMTETERQAFSEYVKTRLNGMAPFDVAKAALNSAKAALHRR